MKIITNTNREGVLCYVQVKDINFLARITKNKKLMEQYIRLINEGRGDDDFVKIADVGFIDIIRRCEYIVEFSEFANKDNSITYLSNILVNMNYTLGSSELEKDCVQHKSSAIRDIMDLKKGELGYKIPLVPNGVVEYVSDDQRLLFDSTVIEDCYVLRASDASDVHQIDYYDFYVSCINKIYEEKYPEVQKEDRQYKSYGKGNILVVSIQAGKKKKSKIEQILNKIKKGN